MFNKIPQVSLIYDRYHKASSTKTASIEIRITHDKKQKYISTGIMIYPNQWKKETIVNTPNATALNTVLNKLLLEVKQVIFNMIDNKNIDIFSIPDEIDKLHKSKVSFTDFCKQRSEIRKYGKTPDSQERYNRFLRFFREWGKIKNFDDINEINIISYDKYLQKKDLKPYSKWNNYHRFLNSFILDAIKEGLLIKNPYNWVNIDRGRTSEGLSKYLTPEEFSYIEDIKLPTECLNRVRDIFIFQTYTCLSYTDLREFNIDKIHDVEDMKVYIGFRKKTGKAFTIPLLEPALQILEKYNNQLPIISNVKYNQYLKVVAQAAGVNKPISSHWARHTGATLLLNKGVDMKIVSKICGHSSTRITEQIYAKLLDETVVNAIKSLPSSQAGGKA